MSEEKTIAKGLDLHSEPVQEILGRPPGWLVRCGISVIVAVIVLLLAGSNYLSYPEVVKGTILIERKDEPARLLLPRHNIGRIKAGQKINLKFEEYPYMDYGFVQITLEELQLKPCEASGPNYAYQMEVTLPATLITTTGNQIHLFPGLSGTAEIITEDLTVFDRLLNPIKAVVKR